MNKLILTAAIGTAMLAGCASKKLPVDGNSYAPGAGEPYTAPDSLSGLQAELVAAAGSDRVFFGYDAYALTAEARQTLSRQAAWLRQHPDVGFSIGGIATSGAHASIIWRSGIAARVQRRLSWPPRALRRYESAPSPMVRNAPKRSAPTMGPMRPIAGPFRS